MPHLREALQSIPFSCCLRRLPARKSKQHVLKRCSENRPCVHPPPFCPQLTLCLLISSSGALLEGPSPPSFWRHKELEIKIFLFCAPSYEKWEPFWFTEWHSGLGRANTQDPNSPVYGGQRSGPFCTGALGEWALDTEYSHPLLALRLSREKRSHLNVRIINTGSSADVSQHPLAGLRLGAGKWSNWLQEPKEIVHEGMCSGRKVSSCPSAKVFCPGEKVWQGWHMFGCPSASCDHPSHPGWLCVVVSPVGFVSCPKSMKERAGKL